ncbi:MAG: ABC transporter ATP-binding protein [bacterium]|nr:ABC transporter ATP-binding protein [bacterium]
MPHSAIRIEHLVREFGSVKAVDDLSLDIGPGSVFGFLGPNGSGKTTTIRMLLGLVVPTTGTAIVLGHDIRNEAHLIRQHCGVLCEHSGLYERLSAEDNLQFYGRVWHLNAAGRAARICELLTAAGLWERRHERVGTWSRGMRQKLAIARAVLHRPRVVILDEPTAGLDPQASTELRAALLAMVASEGTTVFINTHNLAEAEKLCTLVGVIRQGKLLAVGSPDELRRRRTIPCLEIRGRGLDSGRLLQEMRTNSAVISAVCEGNALFIELGDAAAVPSLVSLAVGMGAEIEEVRKPDRSLEDAYLAVMEENQ